LLHADSSATVYMVHYPSTTALSIWERLLFVDLF
jgi:hypothetical protein